MSNSISLKKKEPINLSKIENDLSQVVMGIGWDSADQSKPQGLFGKLFGGGASSDEIDLDASLATFDENKKKIDTISFQNLINSDKSIRHSGDDRTGRSKDFDNEKIYVNLDSLKKNGVKYIVLTVNSFSGQTFDSIENCHARLTNSLGKELVKFDLKEKGGNTGFVMCKITLDQSGGWVIEAIGEPTKGRMINEIMSDVKKHLN